MKKRKKLGKKGLPISGEKGMKGRNNNKTETKHNQNQIKSIKNWTTYLCQQENKEESYRS